jgi:CRISPR type III-A-associated RAMP protein Csm4
MTSGLLARFQPAGPWRSGPATGVRGHVDLVYHSDAAYGAVCSAMERLGQLDEWLAATATNPSGPAVVVSSFFPYFGDVLLVVPPLEFWPPLASTKVRWQGARFVPVSVVAQLLRQDQLDEDRWGVDGESQCLIPLDAGIAQGGLFRRSVRIRAAVDRTTGLPDPHSAACLEFAKGAGVWCGVSFASEESRARWADPVKGALRLLADTGFGGGRSRGWGLSEQPEFRDGEWSELLGLTLAERSMEEGAERQALAYWLLSLYSPAGDDEVDWARGSYALTERTGRVESRAAWGDRKRTVRMVTEGSVLVAGKAPKGAAPNVAPEGFPHPVYRAGFAFALPIPIRVAG